MKRTYLAMLLATCCLGCAACGADKTGGTGAGADPVITASEGISQQENGQDAGLASSTTDVDADQKSATSQNDTKSGDEANTTSPANTEISESHTFSQNTDLARLQKKITASGYSLGAAKIGTGDMDIQPEQFLNGIISKDGFSFVDEIPSDHIVVNGYDKFLYVPADDSCTIRVYGATFNFDTQEYEKGDLLCVSRGEPVLVSSGFSDLVSNTIIECRDSKGSVTFSIPFVGQDDYGTISGLEDCYEFTEDISFYQNGMSVSPEQAARLDEEIAEGDNASGDKVGTDGFGPDGEPLESGVYLDPDAITEAEYYECAMAYEQGNYPKPEWGKFDDFQETMNKDLSGTWYSPEDSCVMRLFSDGSAYLYYEALGYYGESRGSWYMEDRSASGKCPKFVISAYSQDWGESGMTYYIAAIRDKVFWCNLQEVAFYKMDEIR